MAREVSKSSKSNSRAKIIKAAAKVFIRSGYASSLDMVAEEAGVVRRTLFNQFKNKEELFRTVIHSLTEERIHSHFKIEQSDNFRDSLSKFAREYLDYILKQENLHWHRLSIMEVCKHHDLAVLVYESGVGYLQLKLSEMFKKEIATGRLRKFDTELAAPRFLSGVLGSSRHRALLGLGVDSPKARSLAVKAAVDEFIRGNAP